MDAHVIQGIDAGLKAFVGKYDGLGDEVVADLRNMLVSAMKTFVKDSVVSVSAKTGAKRASRRKTGYNLYIRAKFEEVRAEQTEGDESKKTNSQDLMSIFSKQWKLLSDEDKEPYVSKAKELNEENGSETTGKAPKVAGVKPKKSLTGYNLFYKENKDTIKANLAEGEALMKKVGASWSALADEEKEEYKVRAAETKTAE
jgi:hypothetical protein